MSVEVTPTKNERAWNQLFIQNNYLLNLEQTPYIEVTANQINTVREARLMTKFDHSCQLPSLFQKYHLSILPLSRGAYALGRFNLFHPFEQFLPQHQTIRIAFPAYLESLNDHTINSEAVAIHVAYAAKILNDFTNETALYPTISGRMGAGEFDFLITDTNKTMLTLHVENAQIEIDAGYESDKALYLIEAKNHLADDFIVRQLYYPYRLWSERVKKPVRLLYLVYSDGIYYLYEYAFTDPRCYNSIYCVKKQRYVLDDGLLSLTELKRLLTSTPLVLESDREPFPQADSFERLINLCEILLEQEHLSKEDIAENYGFAYRQANYYVAAGRYLGWLEEREFNGQKEIMLSPKARTCFQLPLAARRRRIIASILEHELFRNGLELFFHDATTVPILTAVCTLLQKAMPTLSPVTTKRRAYTLIAWVRWILDKITS